MHARKICLFLWIISAGSLVNSTWWWLAMPSVSQTISHLSPLHYKKECWEMQYLLPRQRELCTLSQNMLQVVSQGAKIAISECQNQFSLRRWNCSTINALKPKSPILTNETSEAEAHFGGTVSEAAHQSDQELQRVDNGAVKLTDNRKLLADDPINEQKDNKLEKMTKELTGGFKKTPYTSDLADIFGGILKFHSRERAFVHSITAAGVAYSITRACRDGHLPSCQCDPRVAQRKRKHSGKKSKKFDSKNKFGGDQKSAKGWSWGGCSDHIRYGERISKDFVDSSELVRWLKPTPRLMNLHNNEAGRRAIRKNMERICKCHGISGSCTVKICWRQMKNFKSIGVYLHRKFDGAIRVNFNSKRNKLVPAVRGHKRPTKRDLVYIEDSPNYCSKNEKFGIKGTTGRRCNQTSYGLDGCMLMCCGRGYDTEIKEIVEECNCKFVWCCKIKCAKCKRRVEISYCK